jgi:hypothetical protein
LIYKSIMKYLKISLIILFSFFLRIEARANDIIIWSGDYETGDSSQWHNLSFMPQYTFIPAYGRPISAGGDGSLFSVVSNPVRQGKYSAKFTVKNSINGNEPNDCDVPYPTCYRRRTEMNIISAMSGIYNGMPYMSERWISASYYIPANWNDAGSGWGIHVFQIKPYNDGAGPTIAIDIQSGKWRINHRWSSAVDPQLDPDVPWQQQMYYDANYPVIGGSPSWDDGVADFVDPNLSRQSLGDLNKGGVD